MRLLKSDKDAIVHNVVEATCGKKITKAKEKLIKAEYALGLVVYPKKLRDKIEVLPKEWFIAKSRVSVKGANGWAIAVYNDKAIPTPLSLANNMYHHSSKAYDKAVEAKEAYKVLVHEMGRLRNQLSDRIHSINTYNKLLEVWPECEKYIPKSVTETKTVVVKNFEDINQKLKIWPKEQRDIDRAEKVKAAKLRVGRTR